MQMATSADVQGMLDRVWWRCRTGYVQAEQDTISYDLVAEDGPSHDKEFTISVKIDDIVYGTGVGSSKKDAEQEAAKIALEKVAKN